MVGGGGETDITERERENRERLKYPMNVLSKK